jgi:hypothetical protein
MGGVSDLVAAVDSLDLGRTGEDIAAVLAAVDRLQAKLATALGEFDHDGLFELDAATSTTAWLRQHGMSPGAAASLARTSKLMHRLPATRTAWLDGELSGGQVQAIASNVDPYTIDLFANDEVALVPLLGPLDVTETVDVMQHWKLRADAEVDRPEPKLRRRAAHLSPLLDGRWRFDADLDSETGEIVRLGLRLAESRDGEGESRAPSERRCDAFADVFRFFLDHQQGTSPGTRHRPHLNVVADINDLEEWAEAAGRILNGGYLTPEGLAALLCDAKINRVITDGPSIILDYGTSTYTASAGLFRAVALRDQHCRHPGCDRPVEWCEFHHVIPWEPRSPGDARGPTSITNGVLKCSRHHHIGHLPGWSEKLELDGTYHLTAPDGRSWTTRPAGVAPRLLDAA